MQYQPGLRAEVECSERIAPGKTARQPHCAEGNQDDQSGDHRSLSQFKGALQPEGHRQRTGLGGEFHPFHGATGACISP